MQLVGSLVAWGVWCASTQVPLKTIRFASQDGNIATVAMMRWRKCTSSIGHAPKSQVYPYYGTSIYHTHSDSLRFSLSLCMKLLQNLITSSTATVDSLWKGVEPPGSSCVGEGHPHPRHERGMKDHTSHFILGRKVDCCHGTDTLAVEDNLVGTEVVFLPQCHPGGHYHYAIIRQPQ